MMPTLASLRNQFSEVYRVTAKILDPAVLFLLDVFLMPKNVALETTLILGMWDT